jgi:tRNA (adenine37-N6)-methyltransferase
VLQQDPRPAYQQPTPDRIYGMQLLDIDLRFRYLREQGLYYIEVVQCVYYG